MSEWRDRVEELTARQIERRRFLKGAAGLGTLAMMESSGFARASLWPLGGVPDPNASGIDTIVLTMMENRSLDHYLGWMGIAIDGVQEGFAVPAGLSEAGCNTDPTHQASGTGPMVSTYHLGTHCLASDPDHGWVGSRVEFNGGAMNGFHARSGLDAMGYYTKQDVPFLGWLAESYVTFSRYFSSVMGPTYPNRRYWLSAQGGGDKANGIPLPDRNDPEPDGHDWPTIFHQLDAAGIPWTYYHGDLATVMLFFNRVTANPGKVRFIADYYADAAAGTLTPVVFLDPSFVVWGNDDHPARDIMWGQRYLYDAFMALAEGPQWWNPVTKRGAAFIVTYDEAGGFYDHVPPPRVADPQANTNHCEDWGRLGFRVPTVVASPFTRRGPGGGGIVAQNTFDHSSIVKFLQWRFNLNVTAPLSSFPGYLGARSDSVPDSVIHNLNEVFDFNPANAHPEFETEPPQIPLHLLQGLGCSQSQVPEHFHGDNPLEDAPDATVPPLARPRLEPPQPAMNARGEIVVPHADWIELADRGFFGRFDFRERAKHGVLRD